MAFSNYLIPDKYKELVQSILAENETIIATLRESFNFDFHLWDDILPHFVVLTNLRLIVVSHVLPGIREDSYYLEDITLRFFLDNIGFYDAIEINYEKKLIYTIAISKKRRKEAEEFVKEVEKQVRFALQRGVSTH